MSLQERIFGLETEYAINFYPLDLQLLPDPRLLVEVVREAMRARCGLAECDFLMNGGKFHHDIGHAEWAIPECRSAREAVVYDKAIEQSLMQLLPDVQSLLTQLGFSGVLFIAKNNVDSAFNTYGCHENYLMLRDSELLVGEQFRHYLARSLMPFLVTRQLFTGAGRLILAIRPSGYQLSFSISQRAAFINCTVSNDTRRDRPLINFGRENETLADEKYRRLHLILGDSNLSGWATWLKLGTTAIILRMIEDLYLCDTPLLLDPVDAFQTVAGDPTCNLYLPMRDGGRRTACDIQWYYFEQASAYLQEFGYSPEEDALMAAWGQALDDMRVPERLRDRVDWVLKKRLLDTCLEQAGALWYNIPRSLVEELQSIDLRYHHVSPDGLFYRICSSANASEDLTLVSPAEILTAQSQPPPYTRARVRGEIIAQARKQAESMRSGLSIKYWTELTVSNQLLTLADPFAFDHVSLPFDRTWWEKILHHNDVSVRLQAVKQLLWRYDNVSLTLLIDRAQHDQDERVCYAAVEALGARADKTSLKALVELLDADGVGPLVRWAVEEAITRVKQGVPRTPPVACRSEQKESLVQILPAPL